MHKSKFILGFVILVSVGTALDARVTNKYGRWGFGKPYGYRDTQVTSNRWEIKGLGTQAQPGYMPALVLRRAAALSKASGFDYFYVVGAGQSCSGSPFVLSSGAKGPSACDYVLSQSALLIAVGIPSADVQVPCEGRDKEVCRSYTVTDVVRETDLYFGLTDDQFEQEVADIRTRNSTKR
jgi:hypothetical protein